jgi:tetratricopeptide (TPR) repeat protein
LPFDLERSSHAFWGTILYTSDFSCWYYNLLSAGEKLLFARLSVFRGGCSLEAIEAVCAQDLPIDVFDGLAALVDKSMIRQLEDKLGEPRFVMLETIQEYALERLTESGEAETLRQRHASYFADLTTFAQPFLRKAGFEYWFPRLTIEQDNIRAALGWSLFGGAAEIGLRMVSTLQYFWYLEGYHTEGHHWAQRALEHLDEVEPFLQIGVLQTAALMAHGQHNLQQCILLQKQGLAIARKLGAEPKIAWGLIRLAQYMFDASAHTQQDYEASVALCEEGVSISSKLEHKEGLAQGLNALGIMHSVQGHYLLAKDAYYACLDLCQETGDRRREAIALFNLSLVAANQGNYREADQLARDCLRLMWELDFTYMTVLKLGTPFLPPSPTKNQAERAVRLLGASAALREAMNIRLSPSVSVVYQVEANVRQQLGEGAFQAAWDEGRKMSLEEAVTYALSEPEE